MSSNDILVWPDGTWCFRNELHDMSHMSDDYRTILLGTEEWDTFADENA